MKFVLEVHCDADELGVPSYLTVNIDSNRLKKLIEYVSIINYAGVYGVCDWDNSTKWFYDRNLENEVSMRSKTVQVRKYGIYYEACMRNTLTRCTSEDLSFRDLDEEKLDEEETNQQPAETHTEADTGTPIKEEEKY